MPGPLLPRNRLIGSSNALIANQPTARKNILAAFLNRTFSPEASAARGDLTAQFTQPPPAAAGLRNALTGAALDIPGAFMDVASVPANMMAEAVGVEPLPVREFPGTSEFLGERLGANVEDPRFLAGQVLNPGPGDFLKLGLAAAGMVKTIDEVPTPILRAVHKLAPDDLPPLETIRKNDPRALKVNPRIQTTGKYRGAPVTIKSPQKLGALRNNLTRKLEEGSLGRFWYDKSSAAIDSLAAGRPGMRGRFVGALAETSSETRVSANFPFAVKGFNQGVVGDPVRTGRRPERMSASIQRLFDDDVVELGPKTGPFSEALNVREGGVVRPTNDIQMARAFGYQNTDGTPFSGGLSEAQHRFMDAQIDILTERANVLQIGGFDDWTPERVQAAIWVAQKAEDEGIPVSKAALNFADMQDRVTANIAVESMPAAGLNHLPMLQQNPQRAAEFQQLQDAALTDAGGRSIFATQAGALTRPNAPGPGFFGGVSNPATTVRVLSGVDAPANAMDPSSEKLVSAVAAAEGLARAQESVGTNFLRAAKVADRNAADFNLGRGLTRDEMLNLGSELDRTFGGAIIPTATADGVRVLKVKDLDMSPQDWQKRVRQIGKRMGAEVEFGFNSGDLVGSFEKFQPSAFLRAIEEAGPQVTERLDVALRLTAPELQRIDEAFARLAPRGLGQTGGERSELVNLTRQILASDGLAGIRRAVEAGLLPAFALAAVTAALSESVRELPQPTAPDA